ncbi:hypothetical protein Bhyg_03686 [Pseudolycoriella hygida]|uniref:Uncharacterized protein n=1 Tax=Pseudolycoriella hygida TaxID=35572 RepID=A0A9Q0S7Q5_9DIPT|nr:hypothetical protein Bhyg_03686 [Pseudolycoriella hygida]
MKIGSVICKQRKFFCAQNFRLNQFRTLRHKCKEHLHKRNYFGDSKLSNTIEYALLRSLLKKIVPFYTYNFRCVQLDTTDAKLLDDSEDEFFDTPNVAWN